MGYINIDKETQIYYKDWGKGQPIVFSHGWPLSSDAWEDQMLFLVSKGFRCIAHDRRGHGRSSQPSGGNDMDTYADDLAKVVQTLDLKGAIHIGHSTGGGEVARYIGKHGTKRVAKAVLIGAVPPCMVNGMPLSIFDEIRENVLKDRAQYFKDFSIAFYSGKASDGLRESFWQQSMMSGFNACYECIKAFSETDFTEDLKKFNIPTLVLHGSDDKIVPIAVSGMLSSKIIPGARFKIVDNAPHGMCSIRKDEINSILLDFIQ